MLKNMGGEPPGFGHRSRAGNFDILEHCRGLGLGAVRMSLPSPDLDAARQLRKKLEGYGMRVIISLAPPKEAGAVPQYRGGGTRGQRARSGHDPCVVHGAALRGVRHVRGVQGELRTAPALGRAGRTGAAPSQDEAGDREPQGLARRRARGMDQTARERVGRRLLRLRQQHLALRGSRRDPATPGAGHDLRQLQGHGRRARTRKDSCSRRWRSARGCSTSPAWSRSSSRRIRNMIFALEMITREPLEDSRPDEEVLGDVRRQLQPAARP